MAANDRFQQLSAEDAAPAIGVASVTPSDSINLPDGVCRGLYVGVSGDIYLDTLSSSNVKFANVQSGTILPVRVARVRATGTTASSLVAMY